MEKVSSPRHHVHGFKRSGLGLELGWGLELGLGFRVTVTVMVRESAPI